MDGPREHLLAGAALAEQQHRELRHRDADEPRHRVLDGRDQGGRAARARAERLRVDGLVLHADRDGLLGIEEQASRAQRQDGRLVQRRLRGPLALDEGAVRRAQVLEEPPARRASARAAVAGALADQTCVPARHARIRHGEARRSVALEREGARRPAPDPELVDGVERHAHAAGERSLTFEHHVERGTGDARPFLRGEVFAPGLRERLGHRRRRGPSPRHPPR